jgi:hypothetical protein
MDLLFGSTGVAAADAERMREINREVGLEEIVRHGSVSYPEKPLADEKVVEHDETAS